MKIVISFIVIFFAGLTACFGQIPPSIPLTPEKAETYAVGKVNRLSGGLSSQTGSGDGRFFTTPYTADGDTKSIAAAFKLASKLSYQVDPAEDVANFASWEIRLPNGNTWGAFWGEKSFKHVKDANGVWQVPAAALNIPMNFGSAPFAFPGAIDGYMIIRDGAGNQIDYIYLGGTNGKDGQISNGYIILDAFLFNRLGELYVNCGDGSRFIYNLAGGAQRMTVPVTTSGFDTSVPGFRTLPDNASAIAFQATDVSLRIKYTTATTATVTFGTGIPVGLTKIIVVEKSAFDANPASAGNSFSPSSAISFQAVSGQTMLVIFERAATTTPQPVNPPRG